MKEFKEASKVKVLEGYREPGSKTFDSSADSIKSIEVEAGVEACITFSNGKERFYPWHRILSYEG